MDPVCFQISVCESYLLDIEGCRCRLRPMHLVSLESLGFRNLYVNRYTTGYCYRQYISLYLIVDIHMCVTLVQLTFNLT